MKDRPRRTDDPRDATRKALGTLEVSSSSSAATLAVVAADRSLPRTPCCRRPATAPALRPHAPNDDIIDDHHLVDHDNGTDNHDIDVIDHVDVG